MKYHETRHASKRGAISIIVQGRRIYVRAWGKDAERSASEATGRVDSVVMIHGLGVSSRSMVPAAEQFARHFRVYAPDLPGFGRSENPPHVLNIVELADTLHASMGALGLERAHFVGNSIGCQVIAHLAVRHPAIVKRIVFVGPTFDKASRFLVPLLLRALRDGYTEPTALAPFVIPDYLRAGLVRVAQTLYFALRDPFEQILPLVRASVLIIRGEHDAVAPQTWVVKVSRLLPNAQVHVISGASHTVHFSDPERFARVALPFLSP